jgi:hypothetical protein
MNECKIEKNDEELTKRQVTEIECLPHPSNLTPSSTMSYSYANIQIEEKEADEGNAAYSCNGNDFNSAEFQFFINAIEKLKATNLFQEEDLKKMTDEQIYEALIEHARTQRYKFGMSQNQNKIQLNQQQIAYNHTLLESIDKEQEEDLPIIMRNLHSVKSLKHFFEIRAKSNNTHNINNSNVQSPLLHAKNNNLEDKETKSNVLQDLFVKNSQIIEKSVKHGIGTVVDQENVQAFQHEEIPADFVYNEPILIEEVNNDDKDDQKVSNVNAETSHEQKVRPLPPPLPDFLLQPSQPPQITIKARTQSSSNVTNENNYGSSNDLHDKLIKEIHNKSLERSKKDAAICLDERGNLIVKPSNRTFNSSQKNQKLHKIKDSSYSSYSNYNSIKSVNGANTGVIAEKISLLTNSNEKPSVKGKNYIKNRPHVPSSVHNQIYQERSEILSKLESIMQQKGD